MLAVIATNWSGPTAFLDDGVGYPLAIDGLEAVEDKGAFEGHMWAAPSVSHLQHLMSHVQQHPQEAKSKGRCALHSRSCMHAREKFGQSKSWNADASLNCNLSTHQHTHYNAQRQTKQMRQAPAAMLLQKCTEQQNSKAS